MPLAQHVNQAVKIKKKVLLVGTASQKYLRGTGVCYNFDYGTATTREGSRNKRVEPCSTTNNKWFAGVLDHNVTLPATGQKEVIINEPGSICDIALGADTVRNTGMLTAQAGGVRQAAGRFSDQGFPGRGSAIPMQTVTAVLERTVDGTGVLSADGLTLTVADSSDYVAGADGSIVVILGGENDGTGTLLPGSYEIASITNGTTIVLTSSAFDTTAGSTALVSFYVTDGNPTCLAKLLDGPIESGLVEWISPLAAGEVGISHMVGGRTLVNGGQTISSDCDATLADETIYGALKGFEVMGAIGTGDFTVDLATAGVSLNGSTLNEVNAMDAALDECVLQWNGEWRTVSLVGGSTEA